MLMDTKSDSISTGCEVELELTDRSGNIEHLKLVIVDEKQADYSHGYLSENTPLARAVLGERAGTVVPYLKDDILSVKILKVNKAASVPGDDTVGRRKARLLKNLRTVEDTNAMVFASSFSGKWGDYDPGSIPKDETDETHSPDEGDDRKKSV